MNGFHHKLERRLGIFSVTNVVVANIVGAGIFTTTGYLMGFLHNPLLMLVLWVVGGFIALCGAVSFGELGAAFPEAGGEYVFISKLFHPMLGFLSGWLSLIVGFSAPIAASAIGFSHYFTWAFPKLQQMARLAGVLSPEGFHQVLAIFIILLFSFIHSRGVGLGVKVQNTLTILKVVLIVGLIVAGFAFGRGNFETLNSREPVAFDFDSWKAIGLSLMFIMFAYSGWNSATYIGSEVKSPQKVIPRSLLIATALVVVLYVFLNLFFVYAVPLGEMRNEPEIGGVAVGFAFGATAEVIVSLLISFALFSSLSAYVMLGPRVYYKMASDGYFFRSVAAIHPRRKVPANAIFLQAAIAVVLVLSGTFEQILVYLGFSLGIFPILAVAGVFKLHKQGKRGVKLPGYPFVPLIFIVANVAILVLACLLRPVESLVALLTALSGLPVYYGFKKRKKRL